MNTDSGNVTRLAVTGALCLDSKKSQETVYCCARPLCFIHEQCLGQVLSDKGYNPVSGKSPSGIQELLLFSSHYCCTMHVQPCRLIFFPGKNRFCWLLQAYSQVFMCTIFRNCKANSKKMWENYSYYSQQKHQNACFIFSIFSFTSLVCHKVFCVWIPHR